MKKNMKTEKNEQNEENGNNNQNKIWNNNSKCNLHAATNHDGQKYGRRNDFSVNSVYVCVCVCVCSAKYKIHVNDDEHGKN